MLPGATTDPSFSGSRFPPPPATAFLLFLLQVTSKHFLHPLHELGQTKIIQLSVSMQNFPLKFPEVVSMLSKFPFREGPWGTRCPLLMPGT